MSDTDSGRFGSLGEQLRAVITADMTERRTVDDRLWPLLAEPRADVRADVSGLSESAPSGGGWLVQEDFINQLMVPVWNEGLIPSKITRFRTKKGANRARIPIIDESSRANGSRWGGVQMYWEYEAGEKEKSKPKFGQLEMKLNKLVGLCYLTDELMDDAPLLESYVTNAYRAEMNFKLTDAIINGTGAGMPQGILNSLCLVQEVRAGGGAVVWADIHQMHARLIPSSRPNAVWLVNDEVENQLAQLYYTAAATPISVYQPANLLSPNPTLYGHPVLQVEQCPVLGLLGDIILCDLSKYIGVDNKDLAGTYSIHVRFVYDEGALKFVYRFDGETVCSSTVTPYDGGDTQSPFVALATAAE